MIFLTLGTQLPFDRLVESVDTIAPLIDEPVFGQIGRGGYNPLHFEHIESLSPADFNARFKAARVVIGHAGIGTILAGFKLQKPLIVMARRASLGEHRNDHQIATAAQISRFRGVYIAESSQDIYEILNRARLEVMESGLSPARSNLIEHLKSEIFG